MSRAEGRARLGLGQRAEQVLAKEALLAGGLARSRSPLRHALAAPLQNPPNRCVPTAASPAARPSKRAGARGATSLPANRMNFHIHANCLQIAGFFASS